MRSPLFVDSHDVAVDEKNRLLIPAEYRKRIDPERDGVLLYLTSGTVNGKPWLYTEKYFEFRAEQEPLDLMAGEARNEYEQATYSLATPIEIDKTGRILIPEKVMKRLGLSRELTMSGVRDHIELWNRAEWESRRAELERRRPEIVAKESLARRG